MLAGRLGQQPFQVLAGEDMFPVHVESPSSDLLFKSRSDPIQLARTRVQELYHFARRFSQNSRTLRHLPGHFHLTYRGRAQHQIPTP